MKRQKKIPFVEIRDDPVGASIRSKGMTNAIETNTSGLQGYQHPAPGAGGMMHPGYGEALVQSPEAELRARMTAFLVDVGQHRDKAAFAELFSHYAPRLKSYLMRLGTDIAVAEDLAQEAMVSVWRKADRFNPEKASAGTWIFTVARNLRIDRLRRENRPELDPNDPAFVPDGDPAPDDQLSTNEVGERVRAVLAELPEDQRIVVRLSFFEEKAHSEIAEELNLPLGTVKSRLRLAFKKLRNEMGDLA